MEADVGPMPPRPPRNPGPEATGLAPGGDCRPDRPARGEHPQDPLRPGTTAGAPPQDEREPCRPRPGTVTRSGPRPGPTDEIGGFSSPLWASPLSGAAAASGEKIAHALSGEFRWMRGAPP